MKKLTILSIVTASFLMTACANETTHAENDIKIIKPASEATTSKIEMKVSSIGEYKSIGDIIKTAVNSKSETKEASAPKVATTTSSLNPEALAKIKASIKADLLKDLKSELETDNSNEQKLMANLKKEIKAELLVELKKELSISAQPVKESAEKKSIENKVVAKKEVKKEASSDAPFDYKLKPKKVADNVWCFFGAIEKPTKENAGNMANNCYIKTNDGYLVMDTGPSYQFALQAYNAMQKIEPLPVKYVVNSHEHDDHWLGNDFYKKKFGTTLVGPESINNKFKDGDKTRMYKVLPENAIKGTHIVKLDKTPKEPYTLMFGGEEFRIIPLSFKAHTGDDIFIYMPKRKVVFAGDLVMNGRITSNRDGSVMGQLKALDMLKKLDWKVLVPGHGFITDGTAMNEAEQYFGLTKERVLKALEDGIDATEITSKVTLPEFKDKAMYDILNAQNIGFAYDELEMLDDE